MNLKRLLLFALSVAFSLSAFAYCNAAHIKESQGLKLTVPDDVFPLVRVETSSKADNIFTVCELGSLQAARKAGYKDSGAGLIFRISKVSEDKMRQILQNDASGRELFAFKDGRYYFYNHPTDVRFMRENNEATQRDQKIWTKVNEWGYKEARKQLVADNNLMPITADNSSVGITLARAMYDKNAKATLSSVAAGKFDLNNEYAEKYLKNLLYDSKYTMTDSDAPDGEYFVLSLPKEKVSLRFYYGQGSTNYVCQVSENSKPLVFRGNSLYVKDIGTQIGRLYQALAEKNGKQTTLYGDNFIGAWHESLAGRGHIEIKKAGNGYKINVNWAESAFAKSFWTMTAKFKNGALVYKDCEYKSVTFNDKGAEQTKTHYKNGKGDFKILVSGELVWNDVTGNAGKDSVFLRD